MLFVPWKESYDKSRQHIKKQRHHFADKGQYSQSYGFSSSYVWMWDLDHKEDWHWRIDTFIWTVVLEKTLKSLLDCKEIKPVNLKGNQPWILIGGLILKLKLQYFGYLIRADSLEKTLMLGKIEDRRIRKQQRKRWLDSITNWMNMSLSTLWEIVKARKALCAAVHGIAKCWTRLSNWITIIKEFSSNQVDLYFRNLTLEV